MKPLKLILFFAALICCIKSYSQQNKLLFGFKGGVKYTTTSFAGIEDIKYKIGICAGLNIGYKVHKNILLLIEANYDQKGCKIPTDFTDNAGNSLGSADMTYAFSYASVPVSVNYSSGGRDVFEAGIGYENGFLLAAHSKVPGLILNGNEKQDNVDIKKAFKSYEPSAFIRIASTLYFTSRIGLMFEGRYSKGISNINNGNMEIKNSGFFLGAGLRVVLVKKSE